jgi:hypothetical protein
MMTFKMFHVVSSRDMLKICKQLQKLLTGVHDLRSVHTWFDSQVGEQPKHTITVLLACRSVPHLVHLPLHGSWHFFQFLKWTLPSGEKDWGHQEECDRWVNCSFFGHLRWLLEGCKMWVAVKGDDLLGTLFCYVIPYILKSNPHPFYTFRGLKNQMRIRFAVESWILEKW